MLCSIPACRLKGLYNKGEKKKPQFNFGQDYKSPIICKQGKEKGHNKAPMLMQLPPNLPPCADHSRPTNYVERDKTTILCCA